jgi:TPR repeat protein
VLPQSDTEAFLWAKRAAEGGLAKALYAVGYFYEVGIGTAPSQSQCVHLLLKRIQNGSLSRRLGHKSCRASAMFKKAADLGDKRAAQRLRGNVAGPIAPDSIVQRDQDGGDGGDTTRPKDKDCIIM